MRSTSPNRDLLRLVPVARHEHLRGPLRPDHARQGAGEPEPRMEAELHEIRGKARLRRGNAEVGGNREAKPGTDRGALHRRHDRLAPFEDADDLIVEFSASANRRSRPTVA